MSYLHHINNVSDSTYYNQIQDNLVEWLDWALLEKGNYFNVTLGELSYDNLDYSLLQISNNENFEVGRAWDGFRPNWVWQSGIVPPTNFETPIVGDNSNIPGISGVYVDDTFYPSDTTGDYSHRVDYYNGRVIFDSPIPTGSKVQAEYSYKYINVIYANSLPWIREVSYNSLIKGQDTIFPPEMTIKLPCIAVEMSSRKTTGYVLGNGQKIQTEVIFHCVAEDDYTRNHMLDIISFQNDTNIPFFDSNSIIAANEVPIDYYGSPISNALRHPDLVSEHPLCSPMLTNVNVQTVDTINSNIHMGTISCNIEKYQ